MLSFPPGFNIVSFVSDLATAGAFLVPVLVILLGAALIKTALDRI